MSEAASAQQGGINEEDTMYNEIAEESRKINGLIYNTIYEAGEKFAGTYVGQYATGKVDRLLKLIEDTAKWSLPQANDKNESKEPLERPLPWIPFITMILVLRCVRLSLSIAGILIGNAPILPTDVVYFIQTRRRKLRAIRITGMREIRRKEQARGQKSTGLASKLRSILSVVVCKPGMHATKSLENQNTQEGTNNKINENDSKETSLLCKRNAADESCSDHDLTLDQIIDKYANANSDDDSDFKPPENVLNKESSSSESTSSATSDDNEDDDDEEIQHRNETTNLKLEPNPNIDNKKHESSSTATENQLLGNTVGIKENGQRVDQQSHKPVPMPKPQKKAPVPIPIHEIKQEPTESDEERQDSQQQSSEESKSSPKQMNLEEKSVVALDDKCVKEYDVPQDKCLENDQMENMNGDRHSEFDRKSEEVFLTPATSNEDLFFSPVGSPNLSSNFGFQPTSILKNPNAVYLERRGPEVVYQDQNTEKQELPNEDHIDSKLESNPQQNLRGGGGKPNKNKLRGKRR